MTYDDMVTRIKAELNRTDKDSLIPGWINDTYKDIMRREDWGWLVATTERNTVVDQFRYEMPSDFHEIKNIILDDGVSSFTMDVLLPETFDKKYPDPAADGSGTPYECCVKYGMETDTTQYKELSVYPKPNSTSFVLRMAYFVAVTDLSTGLSPLMPASYHQILVYGALELGFANLREYEAAEYWKGKKDTLYSVMYTDHMRMPRNPRMGAFQPTASPYPSEYWKKYTVGGIN